MFFKFLLSAALATTSFTPPVNAVVDENMKFATGPVLSLDLSGQKMVVKCAAGPVTFDIRQARVFGPDKTARVAANLATGQDVNIYYHVSNGAIVDEIDLVAAK